MATLRLFKASLAGNAIPRLRVVGASLAGSPAVGFVPIAERTFEPGVTCSTTVTPVAGGPTVDTYTWRQVSGPSVTLTGTGATRSFTTPSLMPGATNLIVLGVTGVSGADTGRELTFNVYVLPQTRWSWNGTEWVGGGYTEL